MAKLDIIPGLRVRHKESGVVYWIQSSTGSEFGLTPLVRREKVSYRKLLKEYDVIK